MRYILTILVVLAIAEIYYIIRKIRKDKMLEKLTLLDIKLYLKKDKPIAYKEMYITIKSAYTSNFIKQIEKRKELLNMYDLSEYVDKYKKIVENMDMEKIEKAIEDSLMFITEYRFLNMVKEFEIETHEAEKVLKDDMLSREPKLIKISLSLNVVRGIMSDKFNLEQLYKSTENKLKEMIEKRKLQDYLENIKNSIHKEL